MPVFLRSNGFKIYFWSNEKDEPIHFHITYGTPSENDTKIWLLSNGSFQIAHNKGQISTRDLTRIFTAMEPFFFDFINFWKAYFDDKVKFYK